MKIIGVILVWTICNTYTNFSDSSSDTALTLLYHSKFLEATPLLEKMIEKDSTNYVARELLARCYYETADYDKAIRLLNTSLALPCDSVYIYFWLSANEARVGRRNQSLAYLEQSVSLGFMNRALIAKNESFLPLAGNGQLIFLLGQMKKQKTKNDITAYLQLADIMEGYWTITNDFGEKEGIALVEKFNPPFQFHEIRSVNGELEKIMYNYDAEELSWTQLYFSKGQAYTYIEENATENIYTFSLKKQISTVCEEIGRLKEINIVQKKHWREMTYGSNKKEKLRTFVYTKNN